MLSTPNSDARHASPVFAVMLFLSAVGFSGSAYGNCRLESVDPNSTVQSRSVTYTFPSTTVSIPRNLPVGSVIARAAIRTITANRQSLRCPPGERLVETRRPEGDEKIDGINGLLQVDGSDAGVAYRIWDSRDTAISLPVARRTITSPTGGTSWAGMSESDIRANYTQVVLVKTSNFVMPGAIFAAGVKRSIDDVTSLDSLKILELATSNSVTIVPQTCQLTSPPTVSLGNHRRTTFTGVGSTTSTTSFSISVDCTGVLAAVHMTMSDPNNVANRSSILPLTSTSTASGVGVQILRGPEDTPVNMGPDSAVANNTNQFKLFDATETKPTHTETFKVRYIQTASTVEPGTANSVVTMTMSYQ